MRNDKNYRFLNDPDEYEGGELILEVMQQSQESIYGTFKFIKHYCFSF